MKEINPVSELRSLINYEEQRILNSFSLESRLGLMEISRSMDLFWTSLNIGAVQQRREVYDTSELITFGLNKAVNLFLDHSCNFVSFPLARSTEESKNWADSVLLHCGRLGLCEHLLEVNRVGLGELQKESDYSYRFQYSSSEPIGLESFEKDDFAWMTQSIARSQAAKAKELEERQQRIWNLMSGLVNTWQKYYIQYEAHPEVDQFYEEIGILHAQRMFGQDSFPGDIKFGGYDFDLYRSAVGILIGWALKHMSFCTQLVKKAPHIEFSNIITIPQDFDNKVSFLAHALEIDVNAAKQALQTLTLTYENKNFHCSVPGNFVAPALIQVGKGRVLSPIWGRTSHPFLFMLNELKRKYRSDWDRAVDQRESIFRQEIYSLFKDSNFLTPDKNINIKIDGSVVTDIDALILDRSTGVLGIFQLKWQDGFGNSIRERESRKRNFQKTGNKWVECVNNWLSVNSIPEICQLCGFDVDDAERVKEFRVFVIGRNAAHFSGAGNLDSRAAWGTWYQLLRFVSENITWVDPIAELHTLMIEDSPLTRKLPKIPKEELTIGDIRITMG